MHVFDLLKMHDLLQGWTLEFQSPGLDWIGLKALTLEKLDFLVQGWIGR